MHRLTQDWTECEYRVLWERDSATARAVVEAKADIAEVVKNSDDTLDSDYDGDGMVSYDEFVDALARDTVVVAAMGKRGMQAKEAMGVADLDPSYLGHVKPPQAAY